MTEDINKIDTEIKVLWGEMDKCKNYAQQPRKRYLQSEVSKLIKRGDYLKKILETKDVTRENVKHPNHYGGKDNPYEAIKVINAWNLSFSLGSAVKYICRAGKKDNAIEDLEKAIEYLGQEIKRLKS
jgi:hypothetical protein